MLGGIKNHPYGYCVKSNAILLVKSLSHKMGMKQTKAPNFILYWLVATQLPHL